MDVWWDPPLPAPPRIPYGCKIGDMTKYKYAMAFGVKHDMVFACTINNQSALALIDSGASDTFVTARMVKDAQLEPNTGGRKINCAGNQTMNICGRTGISLRMGSYMQTIQGHVVKELIEGGDEIKGD